MREAKANQIVVSRRVYGMVEQGPRLRRWIIWCSRDSIIRIWKEVGGVRLQRSLSRGGRRTAGPMCGRRFRKIFNYQILIEYYYQTLRFCPKSLGHMTGTGWNYTRNCSHAC